MSGQRAQKVDYVFGSPVSDVVAVVALLLGHVGVKEKSTWNSGVSDASALVAPGLHLGGMLSW
jgi:hypothetical protein